MEDKLVLGGKEFNSRFILGSGKYNINLIKAAVEQGGAEIITLALRRANTQEKENILDHIPEGVTLLPNTSGARNAEEAVRIARLSRAMGCGDFVKVEIMRDTKYLFPDNYETVKATEILAKEGFIVLPYMNPDLNVARDLQSAGAAAVMPLAAPIGSNKGLATKAMIQVLIDEIDLPIIVDAGIGKPSQACEAMEMGAAAVMANTAIDAACFFCTYKKSPCIYMQRDDNSPWYHPVSRKQTFLFADTFQYVTYTIRQCLLYPSAMQLPWEIRISV